MKHVDQKNNRDSLHGRLAGEIRRQIAEGELKPGDRLPSYAEARERYGVHTNTLEKVHAMLEHEGLIVRLRGKGTFVAEREQRVKERRGIIGVIGTGFSFAQNSGYWMKLLQGIQETAQTAQNQLLFLNYSSLDGLEKADGLIVCDWSTNTISGRVPPGIPCVEVMSPAPGYSSVEADDYGATRDMTRHLLGLGHKKIAYLRTAKVGVTVERYAGYRVALEVAGIEPNTAWEYELELLRGYGAAVAKMGHQTMARWLQEGFLETGCTALLAYNDDIALGAVRALQEAGLRVPEDISVAGFDDSDVGTFFTPRLTTVRWPLRQIGATATEMLLQQINGAPATTERKILSAELLVRDSTAPPSS